MASSDLELKAKDAMIDELFELAVDLYSQAIDICPTNADLYADRAQAFIKLNSLTGLSLLLVRVCYFLYV